MNSKKASFSVYDIVSMVEAGEWDNVDTGIEPPDDKGFESIMHCLQRCRTSRM